jgi:hypothetical protein
MDMNLLYGILALGGVIGFGVLINFAKSKGWIKQNTLSQLNKVEKLIPVVAALTKKLTELDDEDIDKVERIFSHVIKYTSQTIEAGDQQLLSEDELAKYALDLVADVGIALSDEDKALVESVSKIIFMYLSE